MPVNMPTHAHGQGYPGAYRAHRLQQGPVLRRERRLLVRRGGAHGVPLPSARQPRARERGIVPVRPGAARREPGGRERQPALRA
jgi:hypothetical protein